MLNNIMNHIVAHSRDNEEVGVVHEVKITQKPVSIFPDDDGVVLVRYN